MRGIGMAVGLALVALGGCARSDGSADATAAADRPATSTATERAAADPASRGAGSDTAVPEGVTTAAADVLDHRYRRLAGKETIDLREAYGGDVLLIVNTASKCGFTPQYEGLEALHADLSARGFAVLGFPSNDFMGQEPGSEEEIRDFCTLTYGVKFPMFEKVVVTGADATPLYRELAAITGVEPGWNFHKYVVDRSGRVVGTFDSKTTPDDPELLALLERLLDEPAPVATAPPK